MNVFSRILQAHPGIKTRDEIISEGTPDENLWFYGSGDSVTLGEPKIVGDIPDRFHTFPKKYSHPDPFVREFSDVTIVESGPFVRDSEGNIILESTSNSDRTIENTHQSSDLLKNHLKSKLQYGGDKYKNGFDNAILLTNNWANGYFHWIIDLLPKLAGYEKYISETGNSVKILIPQDPPKWMTESLSLLGYNIGDLIERPKGDIHVDNLIVPSIHRYRDLPAPYGINWLRKSINHSPDKYTDKKYIYLSREDAETRRILNEDELMKTMAQYGFEKFVLSELSVIDQIKLFTQADVIVGPHGANLTNTIFSEKATVIEIFGSEINSLCYLSISEIIGHDHVWINGQIDEGDIYVSPSKVIRALEKADEALL